MTTPLGPLAALAGAALLAAGCATGPYYGGDGYYGPAYGYDAVPGHAYGEPAYYDPGPWVGGGLSYGRYHDRGRWHDRGRREWRPADPAPRGPGVEYDTPAERQHLLNRERLLERGGTRDHGQASPG